MAGKKRNSAEGGKESTPNLLFVGNPGTGKSTLINGVIGKPFFDARPSYTGSGITFQFDQKVVPGWGVFMDTPGLADEDKKNEAAEAITKALKQNGVYKIFFVLTTINGRVIPADKATMRVILDAAPTITDYAVIVNQVDDGWLAQMRKKPEDLRKWMTTLMQNLPKKTTSIHFMPRISALDNKTNVEYQAPREVIDFVLQCPGMVINSKDVGTIQADQMEAMQKEFEKKIKNLESNARQMEREMACQQSEMKAASARAEQARQMALESVADSGHSRREGEEERKEIMEQEQQQMSTETKEAIELRNQLKQELAELSRMVVAAQTSQQDAAQRQMVQMAKKQRVLAQKEVEQQQKAEADQAAAVKVLQDQVNKVVQTERVLAQRQVEQMKAALTANQKTDGAIVADAAGRILLGGFTLGASEVLRWY